MLTLISGVSGVGKTTIIKILIERYNWKSIPTYMTRKLREGETDKFSINEKDFKLREVAGDFFSVDTFFGNLYAVSNSSIYNAVNSEREYWIIDRPISHVFTYSKFPCLNIVLLPENEGQLIEQLEECDRTLRLDSTLHDFRENYKKFYSTNIKSSNSIPVINFRDRAISSATLIDRIAKNFSFSSFLE